MLLDFDRALATVRLLFVAGALLFAVVLRFAVPFRLVPDLEDLGAPLYTLGTLWAVTASGSATARAAATQHRTATAIRPQREMRACVHLPVGRAGGPGAAQGGRPTLRFGTGVPISCFYCPAGNVPARNRLRHAPCRPRPPSRRITRNTTSEPAFNSRWSCRTS